MITSLGPDDVTDAVALWTEAGLTRPWNDAVGDFLRAVAGPSSVVLGIREGGELIGCAMIGHDGHRGWVYYLAVVASARGRGLGRELMAAAEAWLVERGLPKIQFMVRSDNAEVLDFYDHLGYAKQDCVVLGRRLD
ncbi:MAG TPA: GNAT family acetyltransferase [Propionicimonas sp.]|jgi:ribosomal protein S18 acetylase RimI-like enzyme